MAAIHYKAALCRTVTVCGQSLDRLNISFTEKPNLVTCAKCQKHQDVVRAHSRVVNEAISKQTAPPRKVTISFEIERDAAWELAQFCKRLTFTHFAECAVGKDNAYVMRDAHELLYAALREAGFNPR